MRGRIAIAATALLIVLSGASLIAQGKGRGGAQAPAAKPTQGPKAPTGVKPPANKSGAAKTRVNAPAAAPKGKSVAPTAKATKPPKTTTTAKTTKSPKTSATTTTTTTSTSTSSPAASTTTTAATLSPAQQKLQKNTNLANKLGSRLPAGTDLIEAAAGFRNLGQFVAAVNVSNNLGIPFADLKVKMVDEHLSLGQSIQALKPAASGTIEARRAEYDAQGMIYQSEQEAQTSTTTSKKKTKPHGSGGGDD